jgi:hypothetical protein
MHSVAWWWKVSRVYRDQPYVFESGGFRSEVTYTPAESDMGLFGGNSNWRGPIWMPINYLMVESLRKFGAFYGDGLRIECPTGSGRKLTLVEIADELRNRLTRIFLRDADGRRPVFGACEKMQTDPHFKDHLLFYEFRRRQWPRRRRLAPDRLDRPHRQSDR